MSAPTPVTRAVMLERDCHRCVRCGHLFRLEAQHRQAVGMGGSKRRPTLVELVTACSSCNARFEADLQPTALRHGWKVMRWVSDPALVPVYYRPDRLWFRLTADGSREPISVAEAMSMMLTVYGEAYRYREEEVA